MLFYHPPRDRANTEETLVRIMLSNSSSLTFVNSFFSGWCRRYSPGCRCFPYLSSICFNLLWYGFSDHSDRKQTGIHNLPQLFFCRYLIFADCDRWWPSCIPPFTNFSVNGISNNPTRLPVTMANLFLDGSFSLLDYKLTILTPDSCIIHIKKK